MTTNIILTQEENLVVSSKDNSHEHTETVECVSLTIPLDSSVESEKMTGDFTVDGPDLGGCVLKDFVCTAVTSPTSNTRILTPSSQLNSILSPSETVLGSNFDASQSPPITVTTTSVSELQLSQNFDNSSVSELNNQSFATSVTTEQLLNSEQTLLASSNGGNVMTVASMVDNRPEHVPAWTVRLKDCEMIGDCYRGYVNTEAELDLLLCAHKDHTQSCWGTRQSPSSSKPSVRLMWKSQYVPYDGVPFLNSGRRATVMECQYGPRRKGNKVKVEFNDTGQPVARSHKPTCPARIYIKKVRKFPEFRINSHQEGTASTRQAQERALSALRQAGIENGGEERYYVQFPLEVAHQYHCSEDDEILTQTSSLLNHDEMLSRLDCRVVEKINELVARGVTGIYEVKHGVIQYVETELFSGKGSEVPPRHNRIYFPTITDLQNHIHLAKVALETGTLATLPPPDIPPILPRKGERSRKRKHSEPRRVRTLKSATYDSLGTLCVQADHRLEINGDGNLQTGQGQVFVMTLPTTSSNLFTTPSDSEIPKTPLNEDNTSLVQMHVVTVPVSASSYLGQQADCPSLALSGQYLSLPVNALPVVSYSNDELSSSSENVKNKADCDSSEKDTSPSLVSNAIVPSSAVTSQNIDQDDSINTSENHHHTASTTTTASMPPTDITCIYNSDIPMCGTPTITSEAMISTSENHHHTASTTTAPMPPTDITCIYQSDIPMCGTPTITSEAMISTSENHHHTASTTTTASIPPTDITCIYQPDIPMCGTPTITSEAMISTSENHHHTASTTTTASMPPTDITCIYHSNIPMCGTPTITSEATSTNVLQNIETSTVKDIILADTIDRHTGVHDLFQGENQLSKPQFGSENTDIIPCYTEQSYNSSLNIIRTHEGITDVTTSHLLDETNGKHIETM